MRLFLRIFAWFWATVVVTGIALVLTFVPWIMNAASRWHEDRIDTARYAGAVVAEEEGRNGPAAASAYLGAVRREAGARACLFSPSGAVIAGVNCTIFSDVVRQAGVKIPVLKVTGGLGGPVLAAVPVTDSAGRRYIYASDLPAGPGPEVSPGTIALRAWVALAVSGLICWFLTRYLTNPVLRLREASRRLASGELATRAAPQRRRDELGLLVRDFNEMADRMERLISGQRQLICDVSHELRSPLARLSVALDMARAGDDSVFEFMERDLERLTGMIERLLAVARLDTSFPPLFSSVNLTGIVREAVRDANFECRNSGRVAALTAGEDVFLEGNADLLRSAVENIVRNALRYTEAGSRVEVDLRPADSDSLMVSLSVRDYGPGVPESELENIFRPFYRVGDARDRESGGVGLGLAIAEKVVRLHRGRILAGNALPHGLRVEIDLPLSAPNQLPMSSRQSLGWPAMNSFIRRTHSESSRT